MWPVLILKYPKCTVPCSPLIIFFSICCPSNEKDEAIPWFHLTWKRKVLLATVVTPYILSQTVLLTFPIGMGCVMLLCHLNRVIQSYKDEDRSRSESFCFHDNINVDTRANEIGHLLEGLINKMGRRTKHVLNGSGECIILCSLLYVLLLLPSSSWWLIVCLCHIE